MYQTGIFYPLGVGDYIKIYRGRASKRYYVIAFNEFGYEYMWRSPRYRWLWRARIRGRMAAQDYISAGYSRIGLSDCAGSPAGIQAQVFVERINL